MFCTFSTESKTIRFYDWIPLAFKSFLVSQMNTWHLLKGKIQLCMFDRLFKNERSLNLMIFHPLTASFSIWNPFAKSDPIFFFALRFRSKCSFANKSFGGKFEKSLGRPTSGLSNFVFKWVEKVFALFFWHCQPWSAKTQCSHKTPGFFPWTIDAVKESSFHFLFSFLDSWANQTEET